MECSWNNDQTVWTCFNNSSFWDVNKVSSLAPIILSALAIFISICTFIYNSHQNRKLYKLGETKERKERFLKFNEILNNDEYRRLRRKYYNKIMPNMGFDIDQNITWIEDLRSNNEFEYDQLEKLFLEYEAAAKLVKADLIDKKFFLELWNRQLLDLKTGMISFIMYRRKKWNNPGTWDSLFELLQDVREENNDKQ
jgi:hypothetical protein